MPEPNLVFKPNITNALLPIFLKNFLRGFFLGFVVFLVFLFLKLVNITGYASWKMMIWLLLFAMLASFAPLLVKIIVLHNTRYYFFNTHVIREFKFFQIKRYSVPYSQIVQVTVDVSFWDRLCKAGDITLHTAEEKAPNVTLHYVKKPHEIERRIHDLIEKSKAPARYA